MRNSPFIQYYIYFRVVSLIQIQEINVNIFFKGLSMKQLTEYSTICLIIKVLDIRTVKQLGYSSNLPSRIHI